VRGADNGRAVRGRSLKGGREVWRNPVKSATGAKKLVQTGKRVWNRSILGMKGERGGNIGQGKREIP